jgi:protein-tyrosine phosphatase
MPEVIVWNRTASPEGQARAAIAALCAGRLVAFPTETVYGIAADALNPDAVRLLASAKGRAESHAFTLALPAPAAVLDWLPRLGLVGRRLARRCWPGPLTLVSGDGVAEGLASRLPPSVQAHVCPKGTLGLRVPDHEAILYVLQSLAGPLALSSANPSGQPDSITAEDTLRAIGDQVEVAITDGACRYGRSSTVVRVDGESWDVLREGALPRAVIQSLAGCTILFVCTGNTCRSPMAEGLFKKMLAERLGCTAEDLPAKGFTVRSAGLAAMNGAPAAPEAVSVAAEYGADLQRHSSRRLSAGMAVEADWMIVMTRGHLAALCDRSGAPMANARLLCVDGLDVPDPIGADLDTYRACARQIRGHLERLLQEVQPK